jgi:hypothetical protein
MKTLYPSRIPALMSQINAATLLKVCLAGTLILSALFFLQQVTSHKKNAQTKSYWFPFVKPDFNIYITFHSIDNEPGLSNADHNISMLV